MKILFRAGLVALALGLVAGGAFASITFQASDTLGVNVFQQTSNNPCVIGDPSCKEPAGMTYNSQSGTPAGQGGTYDLSSPVYTALSPFTVPTSYSGNNIPTSFTIGVDENISTGAGAEQLVFFKTWICSSLLASSCTTLSTANSYIPGSPTDVPNEHNGNGFSDFILTGFSLTNGVHYLFEAEVMNDTDGMEEFFIIPAGSPAFTPEPGTLMLFGSGLLGIAGLVRRKLAK